MKSSLSSTASMASSMKVRSSKPSRSNAQSAALSLSKMPWPQVPMRCSSVVRGGSLGRGPRRRGSGHPADARIGEDIELIAARGTELADNGPLVAALEPVERVRRDGVLVAGAEL